MDSKDTKELDHFKMIKQKKIRNKEDYSNIKGILACRSYHIDNHIDHIDNHEEDSLHESFLFELEKVIFEFQKMYQSKSLRLPPIIHPTLKKELSLEDKNKFISIFAVSFPVSSQFVFVTHDDTFITIDTISYSEYYIPFFSSNKLLSPFPFSIIEQHKTQKSIKVDIDKIPDEILYSCIDMFVQKAIQKTSELQTRIQTHMELQNRIKSNHQRELSELSELSSTGILLSFASFFEN